jgi:predicted  nucleic acid-binding Zn-ribbon protein
MNEAIEKRLVDIEAKVEELQRARVAMADQITDLKRQLDAAATRADRAFQAANPPRAY